MENPFSKPPDPKEMAEVADAMLQAWQAGKDYMAPNSDLYFRYAIQLLKHFGAVRVGVGQREMENGNAVMVDHYRASNGRMIRVGYKL